MISIHALREEGDEYVDAADNALKVFLSTPSARRATTRISAKVKSVRFLSTPSARRATDPAGQKGGVLDISIHALREEGDPWHRQTCWPKHEISIHALREEGDAASPGAARTTENFYPRPPRGGRPAARTQLIMRHVFLSTPSARRATGFSSMYLSIASYFYPRPPRGGRPPPRRRKARARAISIHALREEGDPAERV